MESLRNKENPLSKLERRYVTTIHCCRLIIKPWYLRSVFTQSNYETHVLKLYGPPLALSIYYRAVQ